MGPHLVCPLILSAECRIQTYNPSGRKRCQTHQKTLPPPSHSPRTTDDSHNTQHISPHIMHSGWLQPKQPQTKHKSTSTPFISLSLGLMKKNSSKGKCCNKRKKKSLSAFFDEQRPYGLCSEGILDKSISLTGKWVGEEPPYNIYH